VSACDEFCHQGEYAQYDILGSRLSSKHTFEAPPGKEICSTGLSAVPKVGTGTHPKRKRAPPLPNNQGQPLQRNGGRARKQPLPELSVVLHSVFLHFVTLVLSVLVKWGMPKGKEGLSRVSPGAPFHAREGFFDCGPPLALAPAVHSPGGIVLKGFQNDSLREA
jgi:hypothetical protein